MRKTLLVSIALLVISQAAGCSCCRALIECEQQKNQWLKDHCCGWLHHNRAVAVAPLTAVPFAAPIYTSPAVPVVVAPPQQPIYAAPPQQQPIISAPQPMMAAPPAICQPVQVCPPVQACPPVMQCQPVEQYCPQSQMCSDPCEMICEPMWCP